MSYIDFDTQEFDETDYINDYLINEPLEHDYAYEPEDYDAD